MPAMPNVGHDGLSAAVPVSSAARHLRQSVDPVPAQVHKDFDLIRGDSGSTDGSVEILGPCGDRISVVRQKGPGAEIVVSLTSSPARIEKVHETIAGVLQQTIKPSRVILWLADSHFPGREGDLPARLLELEEFGLEIRWCEDLRSYMKSLPTLGLCAGSVVVAIDDAVCSSRMLEELYRAHLDFPHDVICRKATSFVLHSDGRFRAIEGGAHCFSGASSLNMPVGAAGVLYPENCFATNVADFGLAMRLAPANDDLWLWAHAVLSGRKVRVAERLGPDHMQTECSGDVPQDDAGRRSPWNDFAALCGHYPAFEEELRVEWGRRAGERNANMQVYREQLEGWYLRRAREVLRLDDPRTYNQKIQWLKLFESTPIKTRLADKYLVREWVRERIGEKYLIPLLGVYRSFDEIDFDPLPSQFVIKGNHGCGYNMIVRDKAQLDLDKAREEVDRWMRSNYGKRAGMELHYRDIEPLVVIEKFIENKSSGGDLYDYKFWCFNGRVGYVMFLSERNLSGLKMAFYDRDWVKQPFVPTRSVDGKTMPRPDNLDEMIGLAEKLSRGFAYVRVDLYRLDDGTVYFGEMTFTPASGLCHWNMPEMNVKFGDMIELPKLAYNIDTGVYFDPKETRPGLAHLEELCKEAWRLEAQSKALGRRAGDCDKRISADRRISSSRLDAELAKTRRALKIARRECRDLKDSKAYRVGLLVTWPARKMRGGLTCLRENGIGYTAKHVVGKIARALGFCTVRW